MKEKIFKIQSNEDLMDARQLQRHINSSYDGWYEVTDLTEKPEKYCKCKIPINYEVNNWCHRCNRPIKNWKPKPEKEWCECKIRAISISKPDLCRKCEKSIKPKNPPKIERIEEVNKEFTTIDTIVDKTNELVDRYNDSE